MLLESWLVAGLRMRFRFYYSLCLVVCVLVCWMCLLVVEAFVLVFECGLWCEWIFWFGLVVCWIGLGWFGLVGMSFGVLLCYRCYVSGCYGLRSTGVGFGGLRCLWSLPHCLDLVVLSLFLGYLCWLIVSV